MEFQREIEKLLEQAGVRNPTVEMPPNPELGHFAYPCFALAKERKKAPPLIAQELAKELEGKSDFLEKVIATGPYVNFFIKPGARAQSVLSSIRDGSFWKFGQGNRRILIEYPSPNTNKPLHLGHVRNMVLGSTISRILERDGNIVIQVNLTNDRGVHICKSMYAYRHWGNNQEPDKKSDHFVGDFYVMFEKALKENADLEKEAQALLVAWEQDDPKVKALWKKMNTWALVGHQQTYARYGIAFDKEYYESNIYKDGKKIVLEHMDVLSQDEKGAVIAPLEKYKLPDKVLLRSDGTSIYMTQDIALTLRKMDEFKPDLQIWIVGNEQNLHFQQLFAILDLFGTPEDTFYHLSYGMVALPEGKMKSREGRVVDADDILDELENLAAEEIRKRHTDWTQEHIMETAKVVAMGAIRFFMIKFDPARDFTFDPKSSLSFEGDTGPYLQYTHARICSILAKTEFPSSADLTLLVTPEEQELLRQLQLLPESYRKAVTELKPSSTAVQLLEVGRAFNSFYHACPVLTADESLRNARLHLIEQTRRVIDEGLDLLGIVAPKEM
jgi:arginyl-tRNA synthetase